MTLNFKQRNHSQSLELVTLLIHCVCAVPLIIQTACCFLGELRALGPSCKAHDVQMSGLRCLLSRRQDRGATGSCAKGGGAVKGSVTAWYLPSWELQSAFGFFSPKI